MHKCTIRRSDRGIETPSPQLVIAHCTRTASADLRICSASLRRRRSGNLVKRFTVPSANSAIQNHSSVLKECTDTTWSVDVGPEFVWPDSDSFLPEIIIDRLLPPHVGRNFAIRDSHDCLFRRPRRIRQWAKYPINRSIAFCETGDNPSGPRVYATFSGGAIDHFGKGRIRSPEAGFSFVIRV